jgi:hypothetical protein
MGAKQSFTGTRRATRSRRNRPLVSGAGGGMERQRYPFAQKAVEFQIWAEDS